MPMIIHKSSLILSIIPTNTPNFPYGPIKASAAESPPSLIPTCIGKIKTILAIKDVRVFIIIAPMKLTELMPTTAHITNIISTQDIIRERVS